MLQIQKPEGLEPMFTQNVKEPGRYTFEDAQVGAWMELTLHHTCAPEKLNVEILLFDFHYNLWLCLTFSI